MAKKRSDGEVIAKAMIDTAKGVGKVADGIGGAINKRREDDLPPDQQRAAGCIVLVMLAFLCGGIVKLGGPSAEEVAATATAEAIIQAQTEEAEAAEADATEVAQEAAEKATGEAQATEGAQAEADTATEAAEAAAAAAEAATQASAPPTEAQPPPPSGPVPDMGEMPPDGEPWHPCVQGQIKANTNSGIYHVPGGSFYRRTYRSVWCFNTTDEAKAAGYRPAEQ